MSGWRTAKASFAEIGGWVGDCHISALSALVQSNPDKLKKPYRTGAFGVRFDDIAPLITQALELDERDNEAARDFFESNFCPFEIRTDTDGPGFVTGYYEPIVDASAKRTERFQFPVYARPHDLTEIDEKNPPRSLPAGYRFARQIPAGFEIFPDRKAIEQGALSGQNLEIVWLESKVDLFFIHVQGSARLCMTDGSQKRITYSAKSGHPFTGPGSVLADLGEIPREKVTMQSIREWFMKNPDRVDEILWRNRSFIFFHEAHVENSELGPIAAAKVPLTPGRSIAVDRLIHTFATPFFISAPDLKILNNKPFERLMIAQDTGSAITGPARCDLFFGSGDDAGNMAGVVKHDAKFYILVPKSAAERLDL